MPATSWRNLLKIQSNVKPQVSPTMQVNDDWRRWIGENLMLGTSPEAIAAILVKSNVSQANARTEIDAALRSPYLQAARRLANRVNKRDWVLNIQAQLNRLYDEGIERREKLSGEDFLQQYYRTNRPVIITGMLEHFPARQKWNLDYFAQRFGERVVEVQFGREADPQYELNSIAHKRKMPFGEYVEMVRTSGRTNDFYMTANNDSLNSVALKELFEDVGTLPEYLDDDPGRRGFFWFGPAGTVTPFHHDLTNNFMAQIIGRKKIKLMAPSDTPRVYNHRHCFTEVDARNIDLARFPAMAEVQVLECVLEPGEILFLPVGWWHYVEGLDISVTLSTTNFRWPNDFYTNYPPNHDF
ncbi:cupin-like domain-containing protein [Massilia sp. CCM 8692]|uniref:Cupin-like domain-containing protein n=2 Tax=Telluria group TaxID=2895353 RepID=A0ABX0LR86_9BURK|nr:cupin-like domain-containing protein [Massilia rubra]NHZ96287.1 cupin-like domain-containing protein [Massilia sp. CCM 8734]